MVIFPQTDNESHGIEDLRMVRFVDDDGTVTYYGTCTAFDGYRVLPQLIETRDFLRVGVHTINGVCAQNKGMALFPRRIDGHYVMCSRIDGENLYPHDGALGQVLEEIEQRAVAKTGDIECAPFCIRVRRKGTGCRSLRSSP